jgi:Family of unknown function (DUF5670)
VGARLQTCGHFTDSPPLRCAGSSGSGAHAVRIRHTNRRLIVLYTIALILLVLWVLGLVTSFTAGGLLHILLVLAVIAVVYQLVTGRKVG